MQIVLFLQDLLVSFLLLFLQSFFASLIPQLLKHLISIFIQFWDIEVILSISYPMLLSSEVLLFVIFFIIFLLSSYSFQQSTHFSFFTHAHVFSAFFQLIMILTLLLILPFISYLPELSFFFSLPYQLSSSELFPWLPSHATPQWVLLNWELMHQGLLVDVKMLLMLFVTPACSVWLCLVQMLLITYE